MIELERIYEKGKYQGKRVLADRLWPRGIRRQDAQLDLWAREAAPGDELRLWFGHHEDRWPFFRLLYRLELFLLEKGSGDAAACLRKLRDMASSGELVLLYAAKDGERNNAAVLKEWLQEADVSWQAMLFEWCRDTRFRAVEVYRLDGTGRVICCGQADLAGGAASDGAGAEGAVSAAPDGSGAAGAVSAAPNGVGAARAVSAAPNGVGAARAVSAALGGVGATGSADDKPGAAVEKGLEDTVRWVFERGKPLAWDGDNRDGESGPGCLEDSGGEVFWPAPWAAVLLHAQWDTMHPLTDTEKEFLAMWIERAAGWLGLEEK